VATTQPPVLQARDLVRSYGATRALAGVGLDVGAGTSVAIMGPSGSGKSTLLHVLAGIDVPDSGTVACEGREISRMGDVERSALRRTRFGFVFQFGQLLPELPADENVALPLMLGGVRRRDALERARPWLDALGLAGMHGRRPGEMSGGQAQRVAIARALVGRPAVVFADEPTGSLDQGTGHEVLQVLTRACAGSGAALVVVTHSDEVARWCGRVVHLRDGVVVRDEVRP
jgi:putative ABC transport system ATP-binding protein